MAWYDYLAPVTGLIPSVIGHWDDIKGTVLGGQAGNDVNAKPQNYDAATAQLGQIAQGAAGRAAPQSATWQLAGGPQDQSRSGLMGVADRLGSVAMGSAPGAGEMAVNRQLGQATAAQQSLARAARGANAALAYRNAARNTADLGLAGAAQAAQAQQTDQANANAQLGSIYGTMRGQDIGFAGQNAQLGQQAAIENMRAQLAQTGMNDAQQIAALGQMLGWDQAQINAQLAKAGINASDKGLLGSLLQVGGQIGTSMATGGLSGAPTPSLGAQAAQAPLSLVPAYNPNPYGWTPEHG